MVVQEEMASFGEESVNVKHTMLSVYLFKSVLNLVKTNEKALKSFLNEQQPVLHHNRCLDGHAGVSIFMIN